MAPPIAPRFSVWCQTTHEHVEKKKMLHVPKLSLLNLYSRDQKSMSN